MTNKLVRRYRYIEQWRIGENESWFTDMAAEGLHLRKLGLVFAYFEGGEARQMRYRLDYTGSIGPEQRLLYEEAGWEYVCSHGAMQVFRSPEELGAPELHTDPAEQELSLRMLKRQTVGSGIVVSICWLLCIAMFCATLFIGRTPLLSLVEGGLANLPVLFLLYAWLIYKGLESVVAISKLSRDLQEGRPVNHRANWRRFQAWGRVILLITLVLLPIAIAVPILQINSRHSETLPLANTDASLLRLADIEQNPQLLRKPSIMPGEVDWQNFAQYEWSLYASVIVSVNEYGLLPGEMWADDSGEYSPSVTYELYRLRMPVMAPGLLNDLAKRYDDYWHGEYSDLREIEHPGFGGLLVREDAERKELFAYHEGDVIYLRYYGYAALDQVIEAVFDFLSEIS